MTERIKRRITVLIPLLVEAIRNCCRCKRYLANAERFEHYGAVELVCPSVKIGWQRRHYDKRCIILYKRQFFVWYQSFFKNSMISILERKILGKMASLKKEYISICKSWKKT